MREDLALLSTADLEKAARHPRGPEDARRIAEELASRGRGASDAGTPSLFEKSQIENRKSQMEAPGR